MNHNTNTLSWHSVKKTIKREGPLFPPDEDIEVWLKQNAPTTFQQLADIRYSLYHHCSRADFTVTNVMDDEFDLTGRNGTLQIVSDNAHRYLLWRLRLLGKSKSWIGAIPLTKKPRRREATRHYLVFEMSLVAPCDGRGNGYENCALLGVVPVGEEISDKRLTAM